jgi:hypothetical protein
MKYTAFVVFLALLGCGPSDGPAYCYENHYLTLKHYETDFTQKTPGGIWVDATGQTPYLAKIDALTDELESCLGTRINRECLGVKIPDDWFVSECSGEELLPIPADPALCDAKGLSRDCGCYWRVETQDDNIIVVPPGLELYKAELARIVTGENNVWVVPRITACLQ